MVDVAHPVPVRGEQSRLAALEFVRSLDWLLLAATGALVALGLRAVAGITRDEIPGDPNYYVNRQAVFAAIGAVGFVAAFLVDPDLYRRQWRAVYGTMVGLLVVVFVAGEAVRGSRRWIDIGFYRFQPSEFGKLLLIVSLAGFLAAMGKRIGETRTVAAALGLAVVPALLVYAEPDLGTSLVYGAAFAACVFVAGIRWLHLGVLGALAVLTSLLVLWALPEAGVEVLKPHQVTRLTGFMNPDRDPGGETFQITQSKITVGAGGFDGRGVEGATQTTLDYLPEDETDFVFAAYAEQRGFVGAAILLLLYLLVVWRGLRIVANGRDLFSAIVAGGIVVAFLFQVFVNVGMTIGIAPITGIPLPFVSVGGSSLIANLLAIGVLQAIGARGRAARQQRRA